MACSNCGQHQPTDGLLLLNLAHLETEVARLRAFAETWARFQCMDSSKSAWPCEEGGPLCVSCSARAALDGKENAGGR